MNSIKERFESLRENYTVANAINYVDFLDECSKSDVIDCFENAFVEPIKGAEFTKKFILLNSFSENELNMMKVSLESFLEKAEISFYENETHMQDVRECIEIIDAKLESVEHISLVDLVLESFYLDDMDIACEGAQTSDMTIKQIISKDVNDETKVKLANKLIEHLKADSIPLNTVKGVNTIISTTAIVIYYALTVPIAVVGLLLPVPIIMVRNLINNGAKSGNIAIYKRVLDAEIKKVEAAQKSGKASTDVETYRQNLLQARQMLDETKKVTLESTLIDLDESETVHEKINLLDSAIRENFVRFALSEEETIEESIDWFNNIIKLSNVKELVVQEGLFSKSKKVEDPNAKRLSYLKYLKKNGTSIQEYRKTFKPKFIKYHENISNRLKHVAKSDKSLNPEEIDFLIDNKEEYKSFLGLIDEFSSLKEKDYTMKNFPVVDVDAYEEKENTAYLNKAEKIANDTISSSDKDSFKILNRGGEISIVCTEWLYDANAIDREIKSLESKLGTVEESWDEYDDLEALTQPVTEGFSNRYSIASKLQGSLGDAKKFKSIAKRGINSAESEKELKHIVNIIKSDALSAKHPILVGASPIAVSDALTNRKDSKEIGEWVKSDEFIKIVEDKRKKLQAVKESFEDDEFDDLEDELEDIFDDFNEEDEFVEEGTKSDEKRKKVNVAANKIKTKAHKLKDKTKKAGQGTKAALHQVKKVGDALDDAATNTVNKAKNTYRNDIREEIIEDKTRIKLFRIIRKGIGVGVAAMVNPAVGAITALTTYALSKKVKEKERRRILNELNEELEIVNEKIEDARGDSDKEKKYQLMRIRNQLNRDIKRIQYRVKSDGKGV